MTAPTETYPALTGLDGVRHAFTLRVPELEVKTERAVALARLDEFHAHARRELIGEIPFVTAEQVHGREVSHVTEAANACLPAADGLITCLNNVCLGIYVADCCAVYLVDPVRRAIGLVHSGKKGTELGIVPEAIERMRAAFGSEPRDLIVQLSACIRPPQYETDFAAQIVTQSRLAGVQQVFDSGLNTGAELRRYYSYRMEQGRTGRMLALLALHD